MPRLSLQLLSFVPCSSCACRWSVRRWQAPQVCAAFPLLHCTIGAGSGHYKHRRHGCTDMRVLHGDAGPKLAAAVANAGGLGFLWAARLQPAQFIADYRATISLLEPGSGRCPHHRAAHTIWSALGAS